MLSQAVAEHPTFEAELRDHWQALSPYLEVQEGGIINNVAGNVERNMVQARDVHGGISFGNPRGNTR